MDSQLWTALGWMEKGVVLVGLGNKQASLDWPPALWLRIADSCHWGVVGNWEN